MIETRAPIETVLRANKIHLACYEEGDAPWLWEIVNKNRDRLIESFPILLSMVRDQNSARERLWVFPSGRATTIRSSVIVSSEISTGPSLKERSVTGSMPATKGKV